MTIAKTIEPKRKMWYSQLHVLNKCIRNALGVVTTQLKNAPTHVMTTKISMKIASLAVQPKIVNVMNIRVKYPGGAGAPSAVWNE